MDDKYQPMRDQGHLSQVQEDWWDPTEEEEEEEEEVLGQGLEKVMDDSKICENYGVRVDFRTISICNRS